MEILFKEQRLFLTNLANYEIIANFQIDFIQIK